VAARDSWKLLAFREGKRAFHGGDLLRELLLQIQRVVSLSDFSSQYAGAELIDALLRAGELECALADHHVKPSQSDPISELSNELGLALVAKRKPNFSADLLSRAAALKLPERLIVSTPEGFCYYALHPLDYPDLLDRVGAEDNAPAAAVIGIRSIGATLSAIVKAWFINRGIPAQRTTVRPVGHPFDRKLCLEETQREWICCNAQCGAAFWIVDEGPGLSGSSFLATAEALVEAGVSPQRITLLPSSEPNLAKLFAEHVATRWSRFRTVALTPTRHIPAEAAQDLSWGAWRRLVFSSDSDWPAVWSWTERRKYLSSDGGKFFRFDGYGRYGRAVRRRSEILAEDCWGPEVCDAGDGFSATPWVQGNRPAQVDRSTVIQLARYCAFRAEHFQTEAVPAAELEQMMQLNLERTLGISCSAALRIERPVIADARMMPHEWISTTGGRLLKFDAAAHGDDHFYPGPTDVAWDIAGAITEWRLDDQAKDLLISEYGRISGDKIEGRLAPYLIAYCAFRLAFTRSAAQSTADPVERARFDRDSAVYLERLEKVLRLSALVA
jgi:hypothetical protein